MATELHTQGASPKALWSMARLLPQASRPLSALTALLVLVGAATTPAFALATGALVGSVPAAVHAGLGSAAGHRLLLALAGSVALFAAGQLAGPARLAAANALGRRATGLVRVRVMGAALGPPGVAHLEDPALLDKVAAAQSVGGSGVTMKEGTVGLANRATSLLSAAGSAVVLVAFHWWVVAGLIVADLIVGRLAIRGFRSAVSTLSDNAQGFRRAAYFRDLALTPPAAKETRVFGLGGWVRERFTGETEAALRTMWASRGSTWWVGVVLAGSLVVTGGGVYVLLGLAALHGAITIGRLTAFGQALNGTYAFLNLGMDVLNLGYAAATVPSALDLERLVAEPSLRLAGDRPADGLPVRSIRFEGVAFRYPGRSEDVYQSLDLEIPAGRSLAIVGENGAGKTTLIKLLSRLYDPTAGRITIDGVDLRDLDPSAWQRRVAAIFQDFVRYQLPVTDNIGFGALERAGDPAALEAAAARAGALDIVGELPAGWDTPLARQFQGGVDLSGGQWQRIALARALFAVDGGAGVLVLDEPTANLDVRAEAELYDRFLDLTHGLTTIVISHRFSTVRRADRIVVLSGGRVIEDGSHDELVALGGRYAHMFRVQAARFVDTPASRGQPAEAAGRALSTAGERDG